jgi:hypothetical protein
MAPLASPSSSRSATVMPAVRPPVPSTTASSPAESGVPPISLPNWGDRWNGYCGGTGTDATLRGDPLDPAVTWLDPNPGFDWMGEPWRHYVTWPPGFTARFTPRLEVIDPIGQVVMREGDHVEGSCLGSDAGAIWGTGLDCGPVAGTECVLRFALLLRDTGWPEHVFEIVDFTDEDGSYEGARVISGVAPAGTPQAGTASPSLAGSSAPLISLPTAGDRWSGGCGNIGNGGTLRGDRLDPKVTWLEPNPSPSSNPPKRQYLVWPPGLAARFAPELEIVDPVGQVVMRDGDRVAATCDDGLLAADIWGAAVSCGPLGATDCIRRFASLLRANGWPEDDTEYVQFTAKDGSYQGFRVVTGVAPLP